MTKYAPAKLCRIIQSILYRIKVALANDIYCLLSQTEDVDKANKDSKHEMLLASKSWIVKANIQQFRQIHIFTGIIIALKLTQN